MKKILGKTFGIKFKSDSKPDKSFLDSIQYYSHIYMIPSNERIADIKIGLLHFNIDGLVSTISCHEPYEIRDENKVKKIIEDAESKILSLGLNKFFDNEKEKMFINKYLIAVIEDYPNIIKIDFYHKYHSDQYEDIYEEFKKEILISNKKNNIDHKEYGSSFIYLKKIFEDAELEFKYSDKTDNGLIISSSAKIEKRNKEYDNRVFNCIKDSLNKNGYSVSKILPNDIIFTKDGFLIYCEHDEKYINFNLFDLSNIQLFSEKIQKLVSDLKK